MTPKRVSLYWRAALFAALALSLAANFHFIRDASAQRLTKPRIPPVAKENLTDDQRQVLERTENLASAIGAQGLINFPSTMANHPELSRDFGVFGSHMLTKNTLSARDRELLILRTGWLCRAEYEWAQHAPIGRAAGLTEDDFAHIMKGPDATGVPAHDKLLLRAATELHDKTFISDETWNALAKTYDTKQMMDLVFTVGAYTVVSMAINSFGMQLEQGVTGFPRVTR
jgi:4-carboxymuconolactone decarboxylase